MSDPGIAAEKIIKTLSSTAHSCPAIYVPARRCSFGIPKIVVGESVNFPGGEAKWGKSPDFMRACGIDVIDLHDAECIEMMSAFIRDNPALWNEDIGV